MPSSDRASARPRAAACPSSSTSRSGSSPGMARVSSSSLTSEPLPVVGEVDVPGGFADALSLPVEHHDGDLMELVALIRAQVGEMLERERRLGGGVRLVFVDVLLVGTARRRQAELIALGHIRQGLARRDRRAVHEHPEVPRVRVRAVAGTGDAEVVNGPPDRHRKLHRRVARRRHDVHALVLHERQPAWNAARGEETRDDQGAREPSGDPQTPRRYSSLVRERPRAPIPARNRSGSAQTAGYANPGPANPSSDVGATSAGWAGGWVVVVVVVVVVETDGWEGNDEVKPPPTLPEVANWPPPALPV